MRDAPAKSETPDQLKQIADWTKEYYVVTVTGLPATSNMGRRRGGDDQSNSESADDVRQRMEQRMKDATSLMVKGRGPIAPERIESTVTAEGRAVTFVFPRSAAISLDDKEVDFETALGRRQVKATFALKEMVYHGKLEL